MEILILVIVVAVIAIYFINQSTGKPADTGNDNQASDSVPTVAPASQLAVDALTRVTSTCQTTGGDGFNSLIVAASADGKVSRDELRIIMWFCEALGAKFSDDDVSYVSKLNAGVNMNVTSSAGGAAKIAADCADLDMNALIRLYAAHTAIGKPWNKTAKRGRDTLTVIEGMISAKTAPAITNES